MKEYRIVCDYDAEDKGGGKVHETGSKFLPGCPKWCGTIYTSRNHAEHMQGFLKDAISEYMKRNNEGYKQNRPGYCILYKVYNIRVQERDVSEWR